MAQLVRSIATADHDQDIQRNPSGSEYPPSGSVFRNVVPYGFAVSTLKETRTAVSGNTFVANGLLKWDTSGIPDNSFITSATLRVYVVGVANESSRSFSAEYYEWTGFNESDFSGVPSQSAISETPLSNFTVGTLKDLALNDPNENISKDGFTSIRTHISGGQVLGLGFVNKLDIAGFEGSSPEAQLIVNYTENVAPLAGAWLNLPQFGVVPPNHVFWGSMPHGTDAAVDHTTLVHLQIYRADNGVMAYDAEFEPTPQELTQGYWSRAPVILEPNVTYKAKFRHKDSWDVYSPFSLERTFDVTIGPDPPTLTAPLGKINAISGYNYQGTYTHPDLLSGNAVQIQVRTEAGTAIIFDSGTRTISVANGGSWALGEFHSDLSWATKYTWQARIRDTAGAWGPYSLLRAFRTNSPPTAPTGLSPASGAVSSSRVFSCSVSDPDGDAITAAQIELVNTTTGAMVSGYPKAMTVNSTSTAATFTAPAPDMTLGTSYRFRCRATDGFSPGYGPYSGYVTFLYQVVPEVSMLAPSPIQRRNLVPEPSAEYAESGYWTELNATATDYVERVGDGDADFGVYSWRGVASETSTNARRGAFRTVDGTKPYLLRAGFKTEAGPSASHLKLLCYNVSNTLVGTLYPSSIAACQDQDVPVSWTSYGGIVWPIGSGNSPAFPSGTTQVRIEIVPSLNLEAVVRFDGVSLEQVLLLSSANWAEVQDFFGYHDGDGPSNFGVGGYQWTGTEGNSESLGINVLTAPGSSVLTSYFSAASVAKVEDRTTIEVWDAGEEEWIPVNEPAWFASARTLIPLPSGIIRNQGRYRILIEAKDANGGIGSSGYVEVDARYEGPPQLPIVIATANTASATIDLSFEPTALPALEFGGIEVMISAVDGSEPETIVAFLGSTSQTTYSYHFPVSGREYELGIRQIQIIDADQVEGRWSRVRVTCDYPYPFIKDAEVPSLYLAYDVPPQSYEQDAPGEKFFPWGATTGVHPIGEIREKSGKEAIALYQEPGLMASESERWANLKEILKQRRTICLLPQTPDPDKIFAAVVGPATFAVNELRKKVAEFDWEETSFSENIYDGDV